MSEILHGLASQLLEISERFKAAFENYELDFSAIEPDGDSLVYTLIDPLKGHANANSLTNQTGQVDPIPGPYDPIVWNTGYSLAGNVLDGNPDDLDRQKQVLFKINQN
jgi:hypothetical protein